MGPSGRRGRGGFGAPAGRRGGGGGGVGWGRGGGRGGGGVSQARVEAAVNGSGAVKRAVGTVTLQGELRGFGALVPTATAWGMLMETGFGSTIRTPGTSGVGTYVTVNTFTYPVGDIGEYSNGDIIAVVQADGT